MFIIKISGGIVASVRVERKENQMRLCHKSPKSSRTWSVLKDDAFLSLSCRELQSCYSYFKKLEENLMKELNDRETDPVRQNLILLQDIIYGMRKAGERNGYKLEDCSRETR